MQVEHVDFVSFLTRTSSERVRSTPRRLVSPIETEGDSDLEFRCGQVTLDIFDPSNVGQPFAAAPRRGSPCASRTWPRPASELEAKGVAFDGETIDTGVCHMALFRDPDGNALMLHRRYAPRDQD